jgi:hypothetical protein
MTTIRPLFALAFAVSSVLAVVACSNSDDSDFNSADGTEVAASVSQSSRLEEMIVSPITSSDPAQAAASVAAAQWWPAGCATRSKDAKDPLVVHIHLNNCTGPFGLRQHTGDLTVTFSKGQGDALHADVVSSNMTVNGRAVSYTKHKDISISGETRTVRSTGEWTRENAKGEEVTHETSSSTVIDLSTGCRTTNGTGVTTVGSREVDTTISDYKICRGADGTEGCPSGTLTHTAKTSGKTETAVFDGTASASVTGPKGNTVKLPLVCTP